VQKKAGQDILPGHGNEGMAVLSLQKGKGRNKIQNSGKTAQRRHKFQKKYRTRWSTKKEKKTIGIKRKEDNDAHLKVRWPKKAERRRFWGGAVQKVIPTTGKRRKEIPLVGVKRGFVKS